MEEVSSRGTALRYEDKSAFTKTAVMTLFKTQIYK